MKIKKILMNWLMLASCALGLAIFLPGFILQNTLHAEEPLRPTTYTDYAGKTTDWGFAIDDDLDSAAVIETDVNASPSIVYSWAEGTEYSSYSSLKLCINRTSEGHVDDRWGIKYSIDGGNFWANLGGMSSKNIEAPEERIICQDLDPSQVTNLQVRIDSERNRRADGGRVQIYDIKAEGQTLILPQLEQSAYRFFKNFDSVDLSAIVGNVPGDDRATAITVLNGFMYIAGSEPGGWRIEKRSVADGHLIVSKINASGGTPRGLATDGSFLYIIGDDDFGGNYRWRIEKRFLADLAPDEGDEGFGANGVITSDPSRENESAYGIVIQSDSMYVIGSDRANGANDAQWRIEKRSLEDGSLKDFITHNPSADDDIPMGIAADSEYLYIVGYDRIPGSGKKRGKGKGESNAEWRIEKRRLSDLLLVAEVTNDNPTDNFDAARAIAIDEDSIYVIGCQEIQELGLFDMAWRIEKRWKKDENLRLNTDFGTGGVIASDSDSGYDDQPLAIAIDNTYMYVIGHSAEIEGGGDTAWHIEKRYLSSGDISDELGGYPITEDIDADNNDRAYAVAIDSGYMYIAGYWNPNLPEWRIEKRRLDNGSMAFLPEPSLADPNVSITVSPGEQFRLRLLIKVTSGTLLPNAQQFRLQFSSSCNDDDDDSWTEVTRDTAIAFADNLTAVHGYPLVGNPADPAETGVLTRNQTYVEGECKEDVPECDYTFANSVSAIEAFEAGMWDFSLKAKDVALAGTYYLRVVTADGDPLNNYPGCAGLPQIVVSNSE